MKMVLVFSLIFCFILVYGIVYDCKPKHVICKYCGKRMYKENDDYFLCDCGHWITEREVREIDRWLNN